MLRSAGAVVRLVPATKALRRTGARFSCEPAAEQSSIAIEYAGASYRVETGSAIRLRRTRHEGFMWAMLGSSYVRFVEQCLLKLATANGRS
jgi:hypothetical protein